MRSSRVHQEGLVFHVMSRGVRGQAVFAEAEHREWFLRRIAEIKARKPFAFLAYCLMANHFHMLVRVGKDPTALIMQMLLTDYATRFNRAQGARGHLFEARYKAIPCLHEAYFFTLIRYIHMNPVRGGLARAPGDYPWSSHRVFLGEEPAGVVDADAFLETLSADRDRARRQYREMMSEQSEDLPIEYRLDASEEELSEAAWEKAESVLRDAAIAVASEAGLSVEALTRPGRSARIVRVRKRLAQLASNRGCASKDIARFLRCSRWQAWKLSKSV